MKSSIDVEDKLQDMTYRERILNDLTQHRSNRKDFVEQVELITEMEYHLYKEMMKRDDTIDNILDNDKNTNT